MVLKEISYCLNHFSNFEFTIKYKFYHIFVNIPMITDYQLTKLFCVLFSLLFRILKSDN